MVFNLHRVLKQVSVDDPVVIVEGFFDCLHVTQAGLPCVALMGSQLLVTQEELLVANFNQVILLFDGDGAGRAAADECLGRLARRIFVHVIDLPEGRQPDQLSVEELRELLAVE